MILCALGLHVIILMTIPVVGAKRLNRSPQNLEGIFSSTSAYLPHMAAIDLHAGMHQILRISFPSSSLHFPIHRVRLKGQHTKTSLFSKRRDSFVGKIQ